MNAEFFIALYLGESLATLSTLVSCGNTKLHKLSTNTTASVLKQESHTVALEPKAKTNANQAVTKVPSGETKQTEAVKVLGYQPPKQNAMVNRNSLNNESTEEDKTAKPFEIKGSPEVSDEVLARFQSAVAATENEAVEELPATQEMNIKPITQMPLWLQQAIPTLQFEMHLFASDGLGWVRVNGEDKYQGDTIAEGLILTDILPQHVVLTYQGEQFTMAALSSW